MSGTDSQALRTAGLPGLKMQTKEPLITQALPACCAAGTGTDTDGCVLEEGAKNITLCNGLEFSWQYGV